MLYCIAKQFLTMLFPNNTKHVTIFNIWFRVLHNIPSLFLTHQLVNYRLLQRSSYDTYINKRFFYRLSKLMFVPNQTTRFNIKIKCQKTLLQRLNKATSYRNNYSTWNKHPKYIFFSFLAARTYMQTTKNKTCVPTLAIC